VLAHIHPTLFWFAYEPVSFSWGLLFLALCPEVPTLSKPPSAQSPFTLPRCYLFRWDFSVPSEDATPPSSLLRAHAPGSHPPPSSAFASSGGSLQIVASPCWMVALPDFISASLSLDAWPPTPASPLVPYPFLPRGLRPSPHYDKVGDLATPMQQLQHGAIFRGCRHSFMFRPPSLLATQVAPTDTYFAVWPPWRLLPNLEEFVSSLFVGYANRPNRAIDGRGLSPH
jgi:hypothetical protein